MTKKQSRAQRKKQKKPAIYQPSLFEKRRGGQPGNTNAVKHGLYSRRFNPEEIENLSGMQDGVKDEIEVVRVSLARILDFINQINLTDLTIEDYVALQNLISKNAATVGRLMQVQKALTDSEKAGLGAQLLAALEEVNASLMERDG